MKLAERDAAIEAQARELAAFAPGEPEDVVRCAASHLVFWPHDPAHGLGDISAVESWDRRKVMYAARTLIGEFEAISNSNQTKAA